MSLNFNYHIREKMPKAMKEIGIIKKLSKVLPQHSLVAIYKSFVRPHLDYGDITYDQPNNESFNQKIERIQYNAALAITGAIRGTSQKKLYDELGFESLRFWRCFRKLCIFCKTLVYQDICLILFHKLINSYNTHSSEDITTFYSRTDIFQYSFFPYTILEWNKLDNKIQQSKSVLAFRNSLLKNG